MTTESSQTSHGPANVLLISGFLGAGKTTLLKNILAWEQGMEGTVVLVNEFGQVGIDGSLLEGSGSDVVELASGCICCTLQNDLRLTLKQMADQYAPRRIIIEASGVADPTTIMDVVREAPMAPLMQLDKVVTVMEAECWEAREVFGPLFLNQLRAADLLILNKIDELEDTPLPEVLSQIHKAVPGTRVVPSIQCRIDPETLWEPAAKKAPKGIELLPMSFYTTAEKAPGVESIDASRFTTFSFESETPFDEARLSAFLDNAPFELFRIKGPVRFNGQARMLNFVGGKGDWTDLADHAATRLAFIGWDVDAERVLEDLKGCLV